MFCLGEASQEQQAKPDSPICLSSWQCFQPLLGDLKAFQGPMRYTFNLYSMLQTYPQGLQQLENLNSGTICPFVIIKTLK